MILLMLHYCILIINLLLQHFIVLHIFFYSFIYQQSVSHIYFKIIDFLNSSMEAISYTSFGSDELRQ